MTTLNKIGIAVGALAYASLASASVSFNVAAGLLTDSEGDPMASGVLVLVGSADDDFAVPSAADGFAPGADDYVIAKWNFTDGGNMAGEFYGAYVASWDGSWTAGDRLALMWFPGAQTKADNGPTAGAEFGAYAGSAVGVAISGDDWELPEDGTHGYALHFFADGTVLSQDTFASQYIAQAGFTEGQTIEGLAGTSPTPAKTNPSTNTVAWTGASGALSYTVQRRQVGSDGDWETVAFLDGEATSYPDDDLVAGLTYQYRLIAENGFEYAASAGVGELFSERSVFGGVAVRATVIANDPAKHVYGGVILAPGGTGSDISKTLHLQGVGRDTIAPNNQLFLGDPILAVYDQFEEEYILSNDDWLGNSQEDVDYMEVLVEAGNGNELAANATSHDAAVLLEGAIAAAEVDTGYSFIISPYVPPSLNPKANSLGAPTNGDALVSIYDGELDTTGETNNIRIAKLAARGLVAADTPLGMVGGLDIRGNVPKQVLMMGWGPYLVTNAAKGNADLSGQAITNPLIRIYKGGTLDVLAENDDWGTPTAPTALGVTEGVEVETDLDKIRLAFTAAGFSDFETHPKDALMLVTFEPGEYTVELLGYSAPNTREGGLGFIEVDEIEMAF